MFHQFSSPISRNFVVVFGRRFFSVKSHKLVNKFDSISPNMATFCKITYSEAYKTYHHDLELFKDRLTTQGKNEFQLIQKILEVHGVFLIDKVENTVLPANPNVSRFDFIEFHFHALI